MNETIYALATAAVKGDELAASLFFDAVRDQRVADMGTGEAESVSFYPEMGEAKPAAHIEARLMHYGRHYMLTTPLKLKGRGVEFIGTFHGVNTSKKTGWNQYKVTLNAMRKIEAEYVVSREALL